MKSVAIGVGILLALQACGTGSRSTCRTDADCRPGHCRNLRCVDCIRDADCRRGRYCLDGYCRACPREGFVEFLEGKIDSLDHCATRMLGRLARCAVKRNRKLHIECASDGAGPPERQLAVAEKRSTHVRRELLRLGARPDQIFTVSHSEKPPARDGRCRVFEID